MSDYISFEEKGLLLEFAKKASKLGKRLLLDTHHLTPINFEEEKEKFFKSSKYNPQFNYRKKDLSGAPEEISSLHTLLNNLNLPHSLRNYLKKYINNLYHLYVALQTIGTNEFAKSGRQLFNWDIENIKNIKRTLPKISPITSKEKPKDAKEIKKFFEDCLKNKYQVYDYPILIDNFNHHIITDLSRALKIGAQVKRNQNNINRLIVHEIETHALQRHNINQSQNPLLELLFYKDRHLYMEGLAVYNEFTTNTITKSAYDIYRTRLEAVEILHKSFREIYKHLTKFVSEDKAYITTYRVKRGLGDTSHPGGFPKDAVYLLGYIKIRELEEKGEDIEKLYLYRVPKLGKLLLKYNLLETKGFILPKFTVH